MIIVNFKTYPQASGENAVKLAKIIKEVSDESGVEIIACPQAVDLRNVVEILPNSTWAQHVDNQDRGRATGWFPAEIAKEAGTTGVLLNHSEHQLTTGELMESLNSSKELGLKTLIFAGSTDEIKAASLLGPDYVSYEPPELVGSTTDTVATAKPDVIEKASTIAKNYNIPLIVGAGVHSINDVEISLKLGASGIAVATDVVKAEDQRKELMELAEGFSN